MLSSCKLYTNVEESEKVNLYTTKLKIAVECQKIMEKQDENKQGSEGNFLTWEALKSIICNNIDYYKCDQSTNGLLLHGALLGIIDQIDEARPLYQRMQTFCGDFDFDENTHGNGYRSFLKIFDSAINHTFKILKYVTENRSALFFRKNAYTR